MPEGSSSRSSTRLVVVIVLIVVVVAGGAFAIYKLTRTSESNDPASVVAQKAFRALQNGDRSTLRELSTSEGMRQLQAIDAGELDGLRFSPPCPFVAPDPPTRGCTWSRPGGQLTMQLVVDDEHWLVDAAELGAAGLPPDTSAGATTSSSTTTTG
jgi:hypothetical protein